MAQAALGGLFQRTIALLGLAFKAGTDDLRSSPALSILQAFGSRGARVRAYDPCVGPEAAHRAGLNGCYRDSLESALSHADAAVVTTADPAFRDADWARLAAHMRTPVLIDGRNLLRHVHLPEMVRYYPIGRGGAIPTVGQTPRSARVSLDPLRPAGNRDRPMRAPAADQGYVPQFLLGAN